MFGHEDNEAAAFFRMFDWTVPLLGTEARVEPDDIEFIVATIGLAGVVTEDGFKESLSVCTFTETIHFNHLYSSYIYM